MPLTPGSPVGAYEVVAPIGAGGMGEVYRARDMRLGRDVAIKILPDNLATDPERIARFAREAQLLAALNHQNIAHVYGLEESGTSRALVMELVEGPTLDDRIRTGPLTVDEAVGVARQIADALEAAHELGIVHRDLKPSNIKVSDVGAVKILDFGLAKSVEPISANMSAAAHSPTITTPAMTMQGMVLGTAAYMAPEQAKGKAVDRRVDVWAFGCVLFEMLSGKRAFEGEDAADTIAAVLMKEPAWSQLPRDLPPAIERLLRNCLDRDRSRRISSMAIVRWELGQAAGVPLAAPPRPRRFGWAAAIAGVALIVSGMMIGSPARWRATPPDVAPLKVSIDLGADVSLLPVTNVGGVARGVGTSAVLSPDGRHLAFTATRSDGQSHLHLRPLDQLSVTMLSGSEGAAAPFFSPDGEWIAFFAQGKLKKVKVTGGVPATLCDVTAGRGGTWRDDDVIVFTPSGQPGARLMRVPAAGGAPEPLTTLAPGESVHRWPHALPGGAGVLFTSSTSNTGPMDAADIFVLPGAGGPPKLVHRGGSHARYVASGHVLYVNNGTLFALPFDLQSLAATGKPVPMLEGLSYGRDNGAAQFSVSSTGTLVYLTGAMGVFERPISWLDRNGVISTLRSTPAAWGNLRFSPDGKRLAMDIGVGGERDVWILDGEVLTRVTFAGENHRPVWTHDGEGLLFASNRGPNRLRQIYWMRADGSGQPIALTSGDTQRDNMSWHPSGRFMVFTEATRDLRADISVMPIEGTASTGLRPGPATPLLNTAADEWAPSFSPDGKWLAYTSDESGRMEVYVRPFQGRDVKWQVSVGGVPPGRGLQWSSSRSEVFYETLERQLMVAPYSIRGDAFVVGNAQQWYPKPGFVTNRGYALHPDGNRIAFETPSDNVIAPINRVTLVTGFFDELRRVAPTTK